MPSSHWVPYSIADSTIAGPLIPLRQSNILSGAPIQHVSLLSRRERLTTVAFAVLLVASLTLFWGFAFTHLAFSSVRWQFVVGVLALLAFLLCEFLRIIQGLFLMVCTYFAKNPVPLSPEGGLRVAILTTVVPSKEPLEIVTETLRAMKKIEYGRGSVDVWILDEGDDDDVKRVCRELDVKHFSRRGIPKYHQDRGPFRTKTKAGNHNSWRDAHEHEYDIVAQMDPDHKPFPNFLERTLGYFRDPNVAFVVAPQVYGNLNENFVTKGAAEHGYVFHGIVQRCGGGIGSPVLIGTNHLYRTSAWSQMGGYQDSIIEDHRTSITLNTLTNPATGQKWRGVYTPDILSIGEGPTSWTDYFTQQERWAYGIVEILVKHSPKYLPKQSLKNALFYLGIELFYPSVAVTFLLSLLMCLVTIIVGAHSTLFLPGNFLLFGELWVLGLLTQMLFFFWMQRFNLTAFERHGASKTATLITLLTAPVYTSAFVQFLSGKHLNYVITPKGEARTVVNLSTFTPHLVGIGLYLPLVVNSVLTNNQVSTFWSILTFLTLIPLPLKVMWHNFKERILFEGMMKTIRTTMLGMFGDMGS